MQFWGSSDYFGDINIISIKVKFEHHILKIIEQLKKAHLCRKCTSRVFESKSNKLVLLKRLQFKSRHRINFPKFFTTVNN